MKKIFIILTIFSILTGCSKEANIHTVINKDNYFSSIQYPIFNISTLDSKIKKDINKIENIFLKQKDNNSELNIDFKYETLNDNFLSIIILSTITHNNKKNEIINTYLFDKEKDKFIEFEELIINNKELKKEIIKELKNKYFKKITTNINLNNVFISKNYLNYYIVKDRIYLIQIPLDKVNFKFKIAFEEKKEITPIIPNRNTININKPAIALTFDDGPSKYTNDILNILKENDAKATFFVLGNKVPYYQDILIKVLEDGNEIGNHTYNHKWLTHLETKQIKNQITKTQEIIFENTLFTPTIFRPSYGDLPKEMKEKINLDIILWNVDTLDWKTKNKSKIVKKATNNVKDGDIILMHDIYKSTKDALPDIIKKLKEKGFNLVTVSELKKIQSLRDKNE